MKTNFHKKTSHLDSFWRGGKHELGNGLFHMCNVAMATFLQGQNGVQGPVSRKSRNLTGHFRVSQFPRYLKNGEDLSCQTSQSVCFLLPWKRVKKSASCPEQAVGRFTNGFSGPKSFRDFRETPYIALHCKDFYKYYSRIIFEKCVVTPNFLFGFQ